MATMSREEWARVCGSSSSDCSTGSIGSDVGGLTVGHGEIRDLDGKVRELHSDVERHEAPPMFRGPGVPNQAGFDWINFRREWGLFRARWGIWFDSHQTLLSQTGDAAGREFEDLQARYNELRRRFLEDFQGTTDAGKSDTVTPTDAIANAATSAVKWALVLGAIGLGAYLLIPVIVSAGAARRSRA